jgi:hypothetical protein
MRKTLLILVLSAIAIIVGCTVENPSKAPDPLTGAPAPKYIPDPAITSVSNTVVGVASAVAPVNPWAGITDYLLKSAFGVLGLVAGYVAQKRNTQAAQADATEKQNILATVIRGVEDAGTAAAAVKASIQTRATAAGLQPQLDGIVKSLT